MSEREADRLGKGPRGAVLSEGYGPPPHSYTHQQLAKLLNTFFWVM